MTTEYDRVDVEAARFRMALLEDVGDPVDDLTLSIASMTPAEQDGPDSNPGEPIVLEGVVEVPESLLAESDVVASKVSEISDFARGLGVATRFKLEHPAPIGGGKLPATALSIPNAARDVFEMKGRYTRNLILPRGFALTWSKRGEKQLASIKAARAAREHASVESAQEQASELAAKPVTLTVKVGESGRLFGTVKAGDVAKAVAAAGLGTIDKRRIDLPAHIKSVGKYTANVHVYDDVTAVVTLNVVAGHPTTGHGAG